MRYGNVSKDIEAAIADATKHFEEAGSTVWPDEIEVETWTQTWGSTALGFRGIGGSAITSAYTTLVWSKYRQTCRVYFAGRFAYEVRNINDAFRKAYVERRMPAVYEVKKLGIA